MSGNVEKIENEKSKQWGNKNKYLNCLMLQVF